MIVDDVVTYLKSEGYIAMKNPAPKFLSNAIVVVYDSASIEAEPPGRYRWREKIKLYVRVSDPQELVDRLKKIGDLLFTHYYHDYTDIDIDVYDEKSGIITMTRPEYVVM